MCLHPEHLPQKFISMAGLKPSHLEAVADRNPNINICLCVDNDEAGEKLTKAIVHNFREHGRQNKILISSELRKRNVKDFNDLLKITRSEENTQKARTTKRTCAATDR
jgi:5S rRNA maturation endonuclease (ribonuclease M5)